MSPLIACRGAGVQAAICIREVSVSWDLSKWVSSSGAGRAWRARQ